MYRESRGYNRLQGVTGIKRKGDPSAVTNRPLTNLEEHEFEAPDAPDIIVSQFSVIANFFIG